MCGVFAILKQKESSCATHILEQGRDSADHRGPDDYGKVLFGCSEGIWSVMPSDAHHWQVGLAHRRLSILDLTLAGHQPMVYHEHLWITYNGEVYNFVELRSELEASGHQFRSTSDTEVILAAYAEWGTDCFARLRGMWGIVIWDTRTAQVVVSRDRMGIKPLYLWRSPGLVAIASEIKQFMLIQGFQPRLNPVAALEYLETGYENALVSFFDGVEPITPGTWQRISLDTLQISAPHSYWHPEQINSSISDPALVGKLFAKKLEESICLHLRSDVPVGCALSGGLDSSAVVALVNAQRGRSNNPIHTFTSSFPGEKIDERTFVDFMLDRVNAIPHFTEPSPTAFLDDLDDFVWHHDEPVGGISVYAAYCIARSMQGAKIPVTLNGQGGDEILSGYWQTYFLYLRDLVKHGQFLTTVNHFSRAAFGSGNPDLVKQVPVMIRRYFFRQKTSSQLVIRGLQRENQSRVLQEILDLPQQERRVYEIRSMFLPRLLKWEDRNSMAFSIEGRYPFLDHELIELCLSFAPSTLYKGGWTKWPLRTGLNGLLPVEIVQRRSKFGFEVPQDKWLCGPLRPTLEQWLSRDRPAWGYVDHGSVCALAQRTWDLNGRQDEPGQALFRVFMFDRWLERFQVTA